MTHSPLVAPSPTPATYDCSDPDARAAGLDAAAAAIGRGELVLLPTDTVYGVAADAFTPPAVAALLAAKNRGRTMPVPVLIGEASTLVGLVTVVPPLATKLAEAFWPGGLTLVLEQGSGLSWDLGEAKGTFAVRMPLHHVALELLSETGTLATSSANKSGRPPATDADMAYEQLGDEVAVYLDGGPLEDDVPSTIVDLTRLRPRVLRAGAVTREQLETILGPDSFD